MSVGRPKTPARRQIKHLVLTGRRRCDRHQLQPSLARRRSAVFVSDANEDVNTPSARSQCDTRPKTRQSRRESPCTRLPDSSGHTGAPARPNDSHPSQPPVNVLAASCTCFYEGLATGQEVPSSSCQLRPAEVTRRNESLAQQAPREPAHPRAARPCARGPAAAPPSAASPPPVYARQLGCFRRNQAMYAGHMSSTQLFCGWRPQCTAAADMQCDEVSPVQAWCQQNHIVVLNTSSGVLARLSDTMLYSFRRSAGGCAK